MSIPVGNLNSVRKWFEENNLNVLRTIAVSVDASRKRQDKCLERNKWIEVIDILSDIGFDCVLSGAMHLAAAVGTKCVGVFDYTDPLQIGPAPLERHVIIKKNDISQSYAGKILFQKL